MYELPNEWLLQEEITTSSFIGIVLGIFLGTMWLTFGVYVGLALSVIGFAVLYIIAISNMIVKICKSFLKKTDFTETYRETLLLLFIITPLTIVFITSLEFGGIFGFLILVGYISVLTVPILSGRGLWLLGLILAEMYKKRIAVLKKS